MSYTRWDWKMTEIVFCVAVFVLVLALYLTCAQTRRIYKEQNKLIESFKGEARFLLKEHRRDIEMLDWADEAGHYDARFESIRDELRSAMEKDDDQTTG